MMQLSDIRYKLLLLFIDDMMIEINGENGRMVSVNRGNTIYELQYFEYVRVIQVNEYVNINGVIGVRLG